MFDSMKNSTIIRNLDINIAVILAVVFIWIQRNSGSHLADGLFWQWLSAVLAVGTSVGFGAYSHRKVFPYMRPDKYLVRNNKNKIDYVSVGELNFNKMFRCALHRLAWIAGWVLATVWFLGNSGVV